MKYILTLTIYLFSVTSYASFNEIECEGTSGSKNIILEIEQPFPANGVFKRVNLTISTESDQEDFKYTATTSRFDLRNIIYQGSGLRLEVDLWPDNDPRWGRNYSAILNSPDLNQGSGAFINCQFPNAN